MYKIQHMSGGEVWVSRSWLEKFYVDSKVRSELYTGN